MGTRRGFTVLYQHITDLIGGTPLLRLDAGIPQVSLYAKLEFCNPFGSVKDRAAWAMVRDLPPGRKMVEASSGNTAKALQILAAMRGSSLRAYTNRVKIGEVRDLLRLLGADVHELPGLSECPDPTAPDDVFTTISRLLAAAPGEWEHPSQYTNERNVEAHYRGTGQEIADDLGPVDYLFGGLGTTGSTRGAATRLRELHAPLKAVGVVSSRAGFIPGIRSETEMWDVGLFRPDFYDEIVRVDPSAAVDASLELASRFGVLAGPTTGATYAAALTVLRRAALDRPVTAVLIACDRLEPYLSYFRQYRPDLFGRTARFEPSPGDLAGVPLLTPAQLAARSGDGTLIVDSRGQMAYRIGHVPGAVNIRDDQLEESLAHGSPFSPRTPVVFVCPMGERSTWLAACARAAGQDAYGLEGGIVAWRDAGYPLARNSTVA